MKKFFLSLILLTLVFPKYKQKNSGIDSVPKLTTSKKIRKIEPGVPVKLRITSINLTAKVLPVTLTPERLVDVPQNDVGWYGDIPGKTGTAVFDGHSTGIFNNLYNVKAGDDIFSEDTTGNIFHYRVTKKDLVDVESFPVEKVYANNGRKQLNIVTCAGNYDGFKKDFTKRTIIYSEMVD